MFVKSSRFKQVCQLLLSLIVGGLGVFRVYDGNQTCCHTTCGSFYQTSGDPIKYKPNIWEIAPAIEY